VKILRRFWEKLTGPTTVDEWTLASQALVIGILLRAAHRTDSLERLALYLVFAVWFLGRWLKDFKRWLLDDLGDDDLDDDGGDEEEVETLAPAPLPTKEEMRTWSRERRQGTS
jgi:hypothetical protein